MRVMIEIFLLVRHGCDRLLSISRLVRLYQCVMLTISAVTIIQVWKSVSRLHGRRAGRLCQSSFDQDFDFAMDTKPLAFLKKLYS